MIYFLTYVLQLTDELQRVSEVFRLIFVEVVGLSHVLKQLIEKLNAERDIFLFIYLLFTYLFIYLLFIVDLQLMK